MDKQSSYYRRIKQYYIRCSKQKEQRFSNMIIQPDEDEYMSMHSFRSVKDISDIPKMKLQEEEHIYHVLEETKISLYSNIDLYSNLDSKYEILYLISLFCNRFIAFKLQRSDICQEC